MNISDENINIAADHHTHKEPTSNLNFSLNPLYEVHQRFFAAAYKRVWMAFTLKKKNSRQA